MSTVEVAFNPFDPSFGRDPYPQWAVLRDNDPVHQTPIGFWLLLRYDDIHRFVRDPALSVEERHASNALIDAIMEQALGDRYAEFQDRGSRTMLNLDPPDHTRLRRLVNKAFTPRRIEQLRPRIQQLVDEALDRVEAEGRLEVIGDLAFPLPFAVISEMLGMPDTDSVQLREWSGTLVRGLEPIVDPELINAIADAGDNMRNLCSEAIAWKRQNPADDLLTAMIAAEEAGDMLTDEELIEQVMLLYIAGHETTVNLIGNGTLALLRNPDQLRRLVEDPSLDVNAIEELLRYDPPVQMTRRITLQDVEVGGKTIGAGTFVACVIASANRDPAHWGPDADRLDLSRPNANHHLSFGGGAHYCLGAALARLEAQVAIGTLIRRFPGLELAGEPEWNGRMNLRGRANVPAVWSS
ncbi:MAG TPA: cytochrome P450 [Acidimicrobiales bacterium]|nr:cytochrome P450 [Acidimicrobiales bacterium]